MKFLNTPLLLSLSIAFSFFSCNTSEQADKNDSEVISAYEELLSQAQTYFQPLEKDLALGDKSISEDQIKLGHVLYFDKRLSDGKTQSCNTCHNLNSFGVDNEPTSLGDKGKRGDRNSPTTLNAAVHFAQFWDGRAVDVEEQAGGPILNPVEMAMADEATLIERLAADEDYKQMFQAAFPEDKDPLTYQNLQRAIGAFERQLITPTRFDSYLKGDLTALSSDEQEGLRAFIDAGCTTCHTGPALGGHMFQKFGLVHPYWEQTGSSVIDSGKYTVTGVPGDLFVFKVPSLRNITETYPYFHDGSAEDLGKAIRIMAKTQLNRDLSDDEVSKIQVFLKTLTGDIPEEFKKRPEILASVE